MNLPIKGIIVPMVTPLLENGTLDSKGLHKLIEHMLVGGVHGIFLLGTTGEGPSLSHSLRKQLISEACTLVKKQVPILVAITDTSFNETLELAEHSKKAGADILVVAPPYYFPISQYEMQVYLEHLAPKLPLPFLLYNMPSCTKLNLSLDTIRKAIQLGAVGIKDSSGDLGYLKSLMSKIKVDEKFSVLTGTEIHLPEVIKNGGHGTVAGGANFFPRLFVNLYEASLEQDTKKITVLLKKLTWISNTIYNIGKQDSRFLKGTKCSLKWMGICTDHMAFPLRLFDSSDCAKIKSYIDEFDYDSEFTTTEETQIEA